MRLTTRKSHDVVTRKVSHDVVMSRRRKESHDVVKKSHDVKKKTTRDVVTRSYDVLKYTDNDIRFHDVSQRSSSNFVTDGLPSEMVTSSLVPMPIT